MARLTPRWRRVAAPVLSAFAVVLATALPAQGAPPDAVSIRAEAVLGETGTFTAVGAGLCPSGTTAEPDGVDVTERPRTLAFRLDKLFTCDDGSGTFTLRIHAWYRPCDATDRGVWEVVGGTGAYSTLSGRGTLVGTYVPAPCEEAIGIIDVLVGRLTT